MGASQHVERDLGWYNTELQPEQIVVSVKQSHYNNKEEDNIPRNGLQDRGCAAYRRPELEKVPSIL